ncbi:MAG TPA: hypothetical protein VFF28_04645 [Candidatus Nanoarchaeia archaeon]|nr:hypothetical protein [Candidatus Nanoarchaeia archaeon]
MASLLSLWQNGQIDKASGNLDDAVRWIEEHGSNVQVPDRINLDLIRQPFDGSIHLFPHHCDISRATITAPLDVVISSHGDTTGPLKGLKPNGHRGPSMRFFDVNAREILTLEALPWAYIPDGDFKAMARMDAFSATLHYENGGDISEAGGISWLELPIGNVPDPKKCESKIRKIKAAGGVLLRDYGHREVQWDGTNYHIYPTTEKVTSILLFGKGKAAVHLTRQPDPKGNYITYSIPPSYWTVPISIIFDLFSEKYDLSAINFRTGFNLMRPSLYETLRKGGSVKGY